MPLISVIIPCYNSEIHIGRAIESVLKQSYKNLEIILVDNNSTDRTATILNSYAEANANIIKIFNEPRKGSPFARNKGLLESTGEWLQFLDSDDELLPEKLQHQMELTQKDSNIDLIAGSLFLIRESASGINKKLIEVIAGNPWENLIKSKLGKTSSILWKKQTLLEVGGWNEYSTSSQEYELMFRLLQKGINIAYVNLAETNKYQVDNSISRSNNINRTNEILNNYVDLRIAIRNYLISHGKYTRKLKLAFFISIYSKLSPYKKITPDYVKCKFEELNLKAPLEFIILNYLRIFKGLLKKSLLKIIRS